MVQEEIYLPWEMAAVCGFKVIIVIVVAIDILIIYILYPKWTAHHIWKFRPHLG